MNQTVVWVVLSLVSSSAVANTAVGTTKDACDKSHAVTFMAKGNQKVSLAASKNVEADLPAPVREITWFCGNSQEASSNDIPYDRLRLSRKENGAMTWTFIRLSPPPGAPPGTPVTTARMGDTDDACDGKQPVTFDGKAGKVTVVASQTLVADLASALTEMPFYCGKSRERVANDSPFDQIRVARSPNGAIRWVFYLKAAAPDPTGVCDQVHATGRLVYKDENGVLQPLARVQVKLLDDDFGPTSQEMAHGMTGPDGRFDLTGRGGDSGCIGAGCKRPDPFVEFALHEDHRVEVKDALGNTPRSHTATHSNTCGEIDFHDQRWTGAELEPILYAHGQAAYQTFNDLISPTAQIPGNGGLVGIEYPTVLISSTPYTTWDTIHWQWYGAGKTRFDEFDHEFGHRIRHGADGDTAHFNWDATRFRYLRSHEPTDVTNDGFAFNEGWADYHKTLRHPGSVPDFWKTPLGINVQGDVSARLLQIAQACGGFPRMYATLKDAGFNSIHSVEEFRAEFMKRNPTCHPGASSPPTGGPAPGPLSATLPAAGVSSGPSSQAADAVRAQLGARLLLPLWVRSPLRPTALLTPEAQAKVEALSDRQVVRLEKRRDAANAAYQKALGGLITQPEALLDGSYDKALATARSQLKRELTAAMQAYVQDTRSDLKVLRGQADAPLGGFLDAIDARFAQGAPAIDLPREFWPTTEAM